jgi:hypothetical protein
MESAQPGERNPNESKRTAAGKPWRVCATATERLDGANGLLLAPHVDRLFDRGLIAFEASGRVLVSSRLDPITGTNWNGPRFFGLRDRPQPARPRPSAGAGAGMRRKPLGSRSPARHNTPGESA